MHTAQSRPEGRLRAVLVGLGPDDEQAPRRVINGSQCLVLGGSADAHEEMLETLLRLESELERRGQDLGQIPPEELADIALRIDSPELHRLAVQMDESLRTRGRSFFEASAQELNELAIEAAHAD
jgi:hypothetical protein